MRVTSMGKTTKLSIYQRIVNYVLWTYSTDEIIADRENKIKSVIFGTAADVH